MNKNYQKSSTRTFWITGVIIIVVGLFIWVSSIPKPTPKIINNPQSLAGIQTGDVPWIPELDHLRERLNAIGLPALSAEGTVLHIHQHLDIFINGKPVAVPASIGINSLAGFISSIHVHDNSGIIHVESPTVQTFTLGQFFDIWGVQFTATSIGGYSNTADKILKVFVNGTQYSGDPRKLALDAHQEIVITYGTNQELPNPIPSTYSFPPGY